MMQTKFTGALARLLSGYGLTMILLVGHAAAQTTYDYTGNNYVSADAPYTTADNLTGSFTTADPLPANFSGDASALVTTLSFDDGVAVRSLADSNLCQFEIVTDAAGLLVDWSIVLMQSDTGAEDNQHEIQSYGSGPDGIGVDMVGFNTSTGNTDCAGSGPWGTVAGSAPRGAWTGGGTIPPAQTFSVPAFSTWSLMLLILLMASIGVIATVRQPGR